MGAPSGRRWWAWPKPLKKREIQCDRDVVAWATGRLKYSRLVRAPSPNHLTLPQRGRNPTRTDIVTMDDIITQPVLTAYRFSTLLRKCASAYFGRRVDNWDRTHVYARSKYVLTEVTLVMACRAQNQFHASRFCRMSSGSDSILLFVQSL